MKKLILCENCKKEFKVIPSRIGKAKYCSKECHNKSMKGKKIILCIDCNKERELGGRNRCNSCYGIWWRKNNPRKYKMALKRQHEKEREKCRCDDEYKNRRNERTYKNSLKRSIEHRKKIIRLGNKCNECGESNHFILSVHHIDCNNKNNDIKNLEALCYNCHFLKHVKNKWKPELIDWIKKHACGEMILAKGFKIVQLIMAEKKTEKRIKVRMKEEDKKVILKILKKNFRTIHEKEIYK